MLWKDADVICIHPTHESGTLNVVLHNRVAPEEARRTGRLQLTASQHFPTLEGQLREGHCAG